MKLQGGPWATFLAGATLAALAGCGSYEQRCDLNPYACPGGGGGGAGAGGATDAPGCGPCEVGDELDGCEPVHLLSDGVCPGKQTCSPGLECKKVTGQPCKGPSDCATGVCDPGEKQCATCDGDSDCAAHPDAPLCLAGWCRRAPGAACDIDFACVTNRCVAGLCAPCSEAADCAAGRCDDDTHRCLAAPGEPCDTAAECSSALCVGGLCVK